MSLMRIAEEQGLDGHRSCLTKFSELLLLNGVISTQQMGVALDLVEALFDPGAPVNSGGRVSLTLGSDLLQWSQH